MKVAVLTLTRDRLPYTQHCFYTLRENAGCEYDHFVLDQASGDGTPQWLESQADSFEGIIFGSKNYGVNEGVNMLLDFADPAAYDVIVKFDNDCELLTPNTLNDICNAVLDGDMILSPRIHGLRNPVPTIHDGWSIAGHRVDLTPSVGGIFMAVPAYVYQDGYRYREDVGLWGSDDSDLSGWWRAQGKHVGYLRGYHANHYLTTDGQHADIPDYFARTLAEGKPSIL